MLVALKSMKQRGLAGILFLLALSGCGKLQNNIDVPLPSYSAELVVECYLEPGKVPTLAVTTSVPYLSAVLPRVPTDITVTLTMPNGTPVPLAFAPNYKALTDSTARNSTLTLDATRWWPTPATCSGSTCATPRVATSRAQLP